MFVFCVALVCVCWQCLLLHLPGSPKEGKSWKDAQSICSSFKGTLVAIEDEIEQGRGKVHYTILIYILYSNIIRQALFVFYFLVDMPTFCSIHHHVAPGKLCRCVDWSARCGYHEMGQWETTQLHQLVSNWTKELSHCKCEFFCLPTLLLEK